MSHTVCARDVFDVTDIVVVYYYRTFRRKLIIAKRPDHV